MRIIGGLALLAVLLGVPIERNRPANREECPYGSPTVVTPPAQDVQEQYTKGVQSYARQDYVEAVAWFRKAAAQGHTEAQAELGRRYARGQKVTKDPAEAAAWVRQAADQGDAEAQYRLGEMYTTGWGMPKDEVQAVTWYRKAASQGHVEAQKALQR